MKPRTPLHRLVHLFAIFALGLCVLATPLLAMGAPTSAEDTPTENDTITGVKRVADPETSAAWKDALSISADGLAYSTSDAGQVWVDASVYANATAAQEAGISKDALTSVGKDNFLASISAIASVAAIHEQDSTPNDVVFVVSLNSVLASMRYAGLPYASYLVSALNNAIGRLMDSNTGNGSSPTRVAVVGYNYNVTVLMPLDTYTPNADGKYLTYDSGKKTITVSAKAQGDTTAQNSALGSGSYLQKAISVAGNQLTNNGDSTSGRTPVMVVMGVENPPTANTKITNPPAYDTPEESFLGPESGKSGYGTDAMFATLLTMRHVHQQVDEAYDAGDSGNALTLYTTGIDTTDAVAYLLETSEGQEEHELFDKVDGKQVNLTENLTEAADAYAKAANSDKKEVTLELYGSGPGGALVEDQVTFPVEPDLLDQDNPSSLSCVDHYFAAHSAAAIDWAYTSAIDDTLAVHYISPVDTEDALNGGTRVEATSEIGPGMEVADVKGVQYGNNMLTGSLAAQAIAMSVEDPFNFEATHEFDYIIRSINDRYDLGMNAYYLLGAAVAAGQITYDNETSQYSNRAAWYVDTDGKMVQGENGLPFRLAGQDEINAAVNRTEGTDEATRTKLDAAKSAGATSICETYFYIGNLPNFYTGGDIALYDFYISVTTSLNDGTQTVSASIPSDAIPALRVDVTTHGGNNATAALDDVDSLNPIRLVFEVAPRQNVKELAEEASNAIGTDAALTQSDVAERLGSAAIAGASGKLIVPALAVNADGTTVQAQTVVEGTAAPAGSVYMVEKDTPLYALSPSASVEEGAMPAASDLQPLKTPPTPGETYYYLVDTYEAEFSNLEGIVEATPSKAVRAYVATSSDSDAWATNDEGVYELAAGTSTLPLGQEVTLVTKTENPTDTAPYVRTLSGTMGNNELTLSARLGNNGAIVFETPEPEPEPEPEPDPEPDPEPGGDEGGTTDPDNPGGTTDPDNPGTSTDPDNPDDPGTSTDPDSPDNPDEPDNPGDEPGTDPDNPGGTPGSDSDNPETPGETPGSTPSPDRPSDTDNATTNNNTLANTADMSGSGLVAPLLVIGITILAAGIGLAIRRK
ncbi:MAG TPA: hypothetical protein IAC01_05875 [Candidatus Limicola stercorigallinarum]|nr:hypothetical protein [Candidatus Limicola stercorigallinarum]